ncbi:MAG: hypothetical protein M3N95_01745 [Actinomycetota bacterium]|nr:hypothetical protein [Actinomycetota bacterium]
MTETKPSSGRVPWVLAAALAAVAVALAVVLATLALPARHRHQRAVAQLGLTSLEQQAVDAASKQAVNLLSYRRATFDADYARTVAGTTGALKTDLLSGTKKSTLLSEMTSGKFDLQGQVTASAFEQAAGAKYAVLVSASGYQVPDSGSRTLNSSNRFEITMTRVGTAWLASDLQSVGLI